MSGLNDIGRESWKDAAFGVTAAVCMDGEFHITQGDPGNTDEHWVIVDRAGAERLHAALGRALAQQEKAGADG